MTTQSYKGGTEQAVKDRQVLLSHFSASALRINVRSRSSGGEVVAMMQTGEPGSRYNSADRAGVHNRYSRTRGPGMTIGSNIALPDLVYCGVLV